MQTKNAGELPVHVVEFVCVVLMVVWRCIQVGEMDCVNLESDEFFCGVDSRVQPHHAPISPHQKYLECLKGEKQQHHKCRELSKDYLQCRMDNELMAKENLDEMGFSEDTRITEAKEYDKSKEKEGYVAGKHIKGKLTGWLW